MQIMKGMLSVNRKTIGYLECYFANGDSISCAITVKRKINHVSSNAGQINPWYNFFN